MVCARTGRSPWRNSQSGFTLLEMLLVVLILGAVAFAAVSVTNNADEQFRFEETRSRLELIRTAVIGRPDRTSNGSPVISGFVADIGRLPNSPQELVENAGGLPAWGFNGGAGLWAGWRGPYLATLTESSGAKAYRDGWGNAGGAPNYGWGSFTAADLDGGAPNELTDTLTVQSLGSDGAAGGIAAYAADYPPTGALVVRDDHQLNMRNWTITVTFRNPANGGPALPATAQTLRVRMYHPQNGGFSWPAAWPATDAERDAAPYLSLDLLLPVNAVADGGTLDQTFTFGAADKYVPWGAHAAGVVLDATGAVFPGAGVNTNAFVTLLPRAQLPSALTLTWNLE